MNTTTLKKSAKDGNLKLVQENKGPDIEFLEKIVHAIMLEHSNEEREGIIDWLSSNLITKELTIGIPKMVKKEVEREEKLIKNFRKLLFEG